MDSRGVTRRINRIVWPRLEEAGFESSGRSACRRVGDTVDVVTFWAIGSYNGEVLGVEPHSFKIQLGIWLDFARLDSAFVPGDDAIPDRPEESQCPFRRTLPSRRPGGDEHGLWSLAQDSAETDEVVHESATVIEDVGLPAFERFHDPAEVRRTLAEDPEDMQGWWGFGALGSPARRSLLAGAERRLR